MRKDLRRKFVYVLVWYHNYWYLIVSTVGCDHQVYQNKDSPVTTFTAGYVKWRNGISFVKSRVFLNFNNCSELNWRKQIRFYRKMLQKWSTSCGKEMLQTSSFLSLPIDAIWILRLFCLMIGKYSLIWKQLSTTRSRFEINYLRSQKKRCNHMNFSIPLPSRAFIVREGKEWMKTLTNFPSKFAYPFATSIVD